MATLIAWIGVLLGIGMGAGLAFLLLRQRMEARRTPEAGLGLFVSGNTPEGEAVPDHTAETKSVDPEVPLPLVPETVEKENAVAEPVAGKKSLSDRLRVPTGLQGNLAQVPVHDFLQFLAQGKRTGILDVISGRRHGYVKLTSGQIDHAVFRGRSGLTALFALLALNEGDFEFFEGPEASLPAATEMGEPHAQLEVLEVLLRWETQMKKSGQPENGAGET